MAKKLPKSLGACVDIYHAKRAERLAANKLVEAMKAEEAAIVNHIIDNLSKKDEGGAVGKLYKGIVVTEDVPQVDDWEAFYKYIKKTGSFDLLNRAINAASVRARWDAGKVIPGMTKFTAVKLSVTKVA